jgi:alpha-galactosidase
MDETPLSLEPHALLFDLFTLFAYLHLHHPILAQCLLCVKWPRSRFRAAIHFSQVAAADSTKGIVRLTITICTSVIFAIMISHVHSFGAEGGS